MTRRHRQNPGRIAIDLSEVVSEQLVDLDEVYWQLKAQTEDDSYGHACIAEDWKTQIALVLQLETVRGRLGEIAMSRAPRASISGRISSSARTLRLQ